MSVLADHSVHGSIIVCGYHCSGVEWVHHIVSQLLLPDCCHGNTTAWAPMSCYPGIPPSQVISAVSEKPDLPHKLVLVLRNPKDVYAAMYRALGHEASEQFEAFFISPTLVAEAGSWFDNTLAWDSYVSQQASANVHIIYFNQLIRDFEGEFCRLCRFLDVPVEVNIVPEICSFLCLDGIITDGPRRKRQKTDKTDWQADKSLYEVGLWKNFFLVQFSQNFDNIFRDKMKQSSFDINGLV